MTMYSLSVLLCCLVAVSVSQGRDIQRQKRQAVFTINIPALPQFFQFNNQLPTGSSQTDAAQCQALARGLAPSPGCSYVPVVRDTNGIPASCRQDCGLNDVPLQLQQILNQPIAVVPDYITNNRFNVIDNSINDSFVNGNSYFVFTAAPTTTVASAVVTTTASAAGTVTSGAVTSTSATVSVPTVSTPSTPTTRTPQAIINDCIAAGAPPPGCSFSGVAGTGGASQTCAAVCVLAPPPIAPACNPNVGTHVERCLCVNGAPSAGCTYLASGSDSPLTCPTVCVTTNP